MKHAMLPTCTNDIDPPTPKLVDLKATIQSRCGRCAPDWICRSTEKLLGLDRLNRVYAAYHGSVEPGKGARSYFEAAINALEIGYELNPADLDRIPKNGPLLVVGNHPFGGVEGILLGHILFGIRDDVKILANYLLQRLVGIGETVIPVDPFGSSVAPGANLSGLKAAMGWLKQGKVLAVFPAGEVASFQWRRGRIEDRPWSRHIATLARKSGAAVLPVYFPGRNGSLFQLMGLLHPRLRTAMLPRELVNKRGRTCRVFIGKAVPWRKLCQFDSDAARVDYMRAATVFLRNRQRNRFRVVFPVTIPALKPTAPEPVIPPVETGHLLRDLQQLDRRHLLVRQGDMAVYIAEASELPNILKEIGRLREITFRDVGEGTGRSVDLDRFDQNYRHLFLWNHATDELVGAYRLGLTDRILAEFGTSGLYTSQLFRFKSGIFQRLQVSIEFGRSFIRTEYQKKFNSLMLLWKGIGQFVGRNPEYRILFGPVSISKDYHTVSKNLMVRFLKANNYDVQLSRYVTPRKPFRSGRIQGISGHLLRTSFQDIEDISLLISGIEGDGKGIPILLRQYLKLNGTLLCFNVDRNFSDVVDGLLLVDLTCTEPRLLKKFMGDDNYGRFVDVNGLGRSPQSVKRSARGDEAAA
ncbi:MAG TPA: lysophospholipid acyltransferase family protein [Desulfobacterales bacterium]